MHSPTRHTRARRRRSFTLLELIVVIVVLGVLASVAIVGFQSAVTRSKLASAEATLASVSRSAQALAAFDQTPTFSLEHWDASIGDLPGGSAAVGTYAAGGEGRHSWTLVSGLWEWSGSPTTISISDPAAATVGSALWVPGAGCAYAVTALTGPVVTWSSAGIDQWSCTGWAVESPGTARSYSAPPMPGCVTVSGRTVTNSCADPVDVYVDGEWVGTVDPGATVEFDFNGEYTAVEGDTSSSAPIGWSGGPGGQPFGPPPPPPSSTGGAGGAGAPGPSGPVSPPAPNAPAVTLTWSGTGAGSYQVWGGPSGGPFHMIGTTTSTAFTHTTPTAGHVYQIVPVTAGTPGTPVAPSVTPTPPPDDPAVEEEPDGGVLLDVEDGVVTVSWGAVPDTDEAPLTGYHLYRQPQGASNWTSASRIWSGATTTAADEPPAPPHVWCYRVSAYGPGGESAQTPAVCADVSSPSGEAQFEYTGAGQQWVVPDGVTQITVDVQGAQGGNNSRYSGMSTGGRGGRTVATVDVTPGETLWVFVGGQPSIDTVTGGFNGGGNGNVSPASGGGGASDVRQGGADLEHRVVVAGGGGGSGDATTSSRPGGAGGGLVGGSGSNSTCVGQPASGGTQSAGGSGGSRSGCTLLAPNPGPGTPGTFGQGGRGGIRYGSVANGGGGGGGGGWYGGGGGVGEAAGNGGGNGGAGGSGYAHPDTTVLTIESGVRTGHGLVIITWEA